MILVMHSESMTFESSMWAIDILYCFQPSSNNTEIEKPKIVKSCHELVFL